MDGVERQLHEAAAALQAEAHDLDVAVETRWSGPLRAQGLVASNLWTDAFEPVRRRWPLTWTWTDLQSPEEAERKMRRFVADRPDLEPLPVDQALVDLLAERDGLRTTVRLADGRRLDVRNIAWGYDAYSAYAHVTTNCSPYIHGAEVEYVLTSNVAAVEDGSGATIWTAR